MKTYFSFALILLFSLSVSSQDLLQSLEAHFKFDGDLLDETDNENDLEEFSSTVDYSTVEGNDQSLTLAGFSGARGVNRLDVSNFDNLAISVWVKASEISTSHQTIVAGASIGFSIGVFANSGNTHAFMDGSSSGAYETEAILSDGEWHHVLMQSDGSETFIYMDGALDGSLNESLALGNGADNNRLMVGISNLELTPFTGEINELRIYSRFLTPSDIALLSKPGVTTSTGGVAINAPASLTIYPNPANNWINWLPSSPKQYALYAANGTQVRKGSGTRVDIANLASGMYYLKLEGQKLKKVIVQKEMVYP